MTQLREETQQPVDMAEVGVRLRDALVLHLKISEYITLTDGIECYE